MTTGFRVPPPLIAQVALAVLRRKRRSLARDSRHCLTRAGIPWRVDATEYIPDAGPFLLVGNHYQRSGLWAGWGAMVVTVAAHERVGRDVHWLMVSELLDFRLAGLRIPRPVLRRIFARFAQVYGFGLVSARESGVVGGVGGLRIAARFLAAGEPVALLPEGTASLALTGARPGVGSAIEWLARNGLPIVPFGVAEREGALEARFGRPIALAEVTGEKAERDRALSTLVMRAIAELLPVELRGNYGGGSEISGQ